MSVKSVRSDGRECGRVIPPDEQSKMLNAAASLRDKALIVLLLWGLRRVEVQRLNVGDITLSEEGIEVAIVGKGLKKRKITIGGRQAGIVWSYCQTREGGRPLFPGHCGDQELKRITQAGISWVFNRIAQDAGVQATTHDCRRTSITEMNEEGITVLDIALYHGHSNPATTMTYVKDDKKRIMSAAATMAARRG
jgi:integrase